MHVVSGEIDSHGAEESQRLRDCFAFGATQDAQNRLLRQIGSVVRAHLPRQKTQSFARVMYDQFTQAEVHGGFR